MRRITYKRLKIQNFLSVGNDEVVIEFQDGLNLITGNNIDNPERKNAVGKSVIPESFFYVVYGKTIREIKQEFVINNITKGKGNIELEFDVQTETWEKSYKIVRQVKPSKVELWENGVDITKDCIANTNKFICDLIGNNAVLCKSCDILSLSDNVPFMAKKPEEKKKFNEDILSLEVFGKMLKDVKEFIKINKADKNVSSAKIDEIVKSLESIQRQKEAFRVQLEERDEVLRERKKGFENEIKTIEEEITTYIIPDISKLEETQSKILTAFTKYEGLVAKVYGDICSLKGEKRLKVTDIEKTSSVGGAECSECLQQIPHTHIEQLARVLEKQKTELDVLTDHISSLTEEMEELDTQKQKYREAVRKCSDKVDKAERDQSKLESLREKLVRVKMSLKNVEDDFKQQDTPIFDTSIDETQDRLDKENETLLSLKQAGDDWDTCKFILGEEGVKSFVIKKLLGILNLSIQQNITELGMTMRCTFDEYFDEKITNEKGVDISYWNFSGGERRTVDLAIAWAFKDLKRKISGVSSNVEWVDEVFDAAFDERGLDLLIEAMKNRIDKNNLSVYAISHRSEMYKHIDGEIVHLEKENGLTRRVLPLN